MSLPMTLGLGMLAVVALLALLLLVGLWIVEYLHHIRAAVERQAAALERMEGRR